MIKYCEKHFKIILNVLTKNSIANCLIYITILIFNLINSLISNLIKQKFVTKAHFLKFYSLTTIIIIDSPFLLSFKLILIHTKFFLYNILPTFKNSSINHLQIQIYSFYLLYYKIYRNPLKLIYFRGFYNKKII